VLDAPLTRSTRRPQSRAKIANVASQMTCFLWVIEDSIRDESA
jgi:hypothetical protein